MQSEIKSSKILSVRIPFNIIDSLLSTTTTTSTTTARFPTTTIVDPSSGSTISGTKIKFFVYDRNSWLLAGENRLCPRIGNGESHWGHTPASNPVFGVPKLAINPFFRYCP